MKFKIYQIDAFTKEVFGGNPAAVIPLSYWPEDEVLQKIAMENNLSETAFYAKEGEGFRLRWFTPTSEVKLCGHATLATAYVLFERLQYSQEHILFYTLSGVLKVWKSSDTMLSMEFPLSTYSYLGREKYNIDTLKLPIVDLVESDDLVLVVDNEETVKNFQPNFETLSKIDTRCVIITAQGDDVDFVSRVFAPRYGINEDPVTGSAHTLLAAYWTSKLNKNTLIAKQASARSGLLYLDVQDKMVVISGECAFYMEGEITLT